MHCFHPYYRFSVICLVDCLAGTMEHAKKLVLIEPRLLEQLQAHSEYKDLQKPTDKKTKASISLDLQKMLEDDGVSDDIKAKIYQQTFSKFRSLSDHIPTSEKVDINSLTTPIVPRQRWQQKTPQRRTRKSKTWSQY